jgi:hypothetical protein
MAKKLSKTGRMLMRSTKAQIYRAYMQGYEAGEKYLQSVTSTNDFIPILNTDWTVDYRDGFVDGYNDTLENMRIE